MPNIIDPVAEGIIKPVDDNYLLFKTVKVIFKDDSTNEDGVIAYHKDTSVLVLPLSSETYKSPIKLIHEATLRGNEVFKDMIRNAYENKTSIIINNKILVNWEDYQHLFKQCSFYSPYEKKNSVIISDWKEKTDER